MIIVENTVEATKYVAKKNSIFTKNLFAIEQEKKEDKGEAPGKEGETVSYVK